MPNNVSNNSLPRIHVGLEGQCFNKDASFCHRDDQAIGLQELNVKDFKPSFRSGQTKFFSTKNHAEARRLIDRDGEAKLGEPLGGSCLGASLLFLKAKVAEERSDVNCRPSRQAAIDLQENYNVQPVTTGTGVEGYDAILDGLGLRKSMVKFKYGAADASRFVERLMSEVYNSDEKNDKTYMVDQFFL